MSGRKCAGVRGGLIATNVKDYYDRLLEWLPVYEGFATYGGMSTELTPLGSGRLFQRQLDRHFQR